MIQIHLRFNNKKMIEPLCLYFSYVHCKLIEVGGMNERMNGVRSYVP